MSQPHTRHDGRALPAMHPERLDHIDRTPIHEGELVDFHDEMHQRYDVHTGGGSAVWRTGRICYTQVGSVGIIDLHRRNRADNGWRPVYQGAIVLRSRVRRPCDGSEPVDGLRRGQP